MAKKKKSKGKRRGGKRKGKKSRGKLRGHKFGIAESLGAAKTALDVGSDQMTNYKYLVKNPSFEGLKDNATLTYNSLKAHGTPLVFGVVVSNADKLPFIGQLLKGPKHKLDAITRKWLGMRL